LTHTVQNSYRYCREIARKRAKNFYYSFLLLDTQQRDSMCAVYAYMRYCDDLSDDPANSDKEAVRRSIAMWRMELNRALNSEAVSEETGDHILWPAFADTVKRYDIPHRFFHEMIDGILSDLEPQRMETFDELYRYCYQVASVVGLTIIHIFGFDSIRALLLAEKCGVAFQLTNILRDVREDAKLGRIYLPKTDLDKFGVTVDQLQSGSENEEFRNLMRFEADRALAYYSESAPLLGMTHKKSRGSLWALREIYLNLLSRLERSNFEVLSRRVNVPKYVKIALLLRAFTK
jgi:15-cis-phytoene synthase